MRLFNLFKEKKEVPPPPPKSKVLIAEDEEYLRDFYQELLEGEGFDVITAKNGQEAFDLAIQNQPEVVILDVMMPVMDGLQVLEKLKSDEQTKKTPIIVLTNAGNIENMERANAQKAFRFLIKSNILPDELVRTTHAAINSRISPES